MRVDLQILVGLLDALLQRLEVLVGEILAGEQRAGVAIVGLHVLEQAHYDVGNAVAHGMDGAVGDADDVAVGDGVALGVLGVLDGGGDLAGLDVGERLGHGLDVILEGCLAVHAEHGGEGLRHGLGGHDARRDVGQLAG